MSAESVGRTRTPKPALYRVIGIDGSPLHVKALTKAGAISAAAEGRITAERIDALDAVGIDPASIIDGTIGHASPQV